ncbi:hypothetical protein FACS1894218_2970 [Bacilli bacterium]|nr:hypothetical protein FACS1894218_2970 [Bacilli bacterium]
MGHLYNFHSLIIPKAIAHVKPKKIIIPYQATDKLPMLNATEVTPLSYGPLPKVLTSTNIMVGAIMMIDNEINNQIKKSLL